MHYQCGTAVCVSVTLDSGKDGSSWFAQRNLVLEEIGGLPGTTNRNDLQPSSAAPGAGRADPEGFIAQTGSLIFTARVWTAVVTDRAILVVRGGHARRVRRDTLFGEPTGMYHAIQFAKRIECIGSATRKSLPQTRLYGRRSRVTIQPSAITKDCARTLSFEVVDPTTPTRFAAPGIVEGQRNQALQPARAQKTTSALVTPASSPVSSPRRAQRRK